MLPQWKGEPPDDGRDVLGQSLSIERCSSSFSSSSDLSTQAAYAVSQAETTHHLQASADAGVSGEVLPPPAARVLQSMTRANPDGRVGDDSARRITVQPPRSVEEAGDGGVFEVAFEAMTDGVINFDSTGDVTYVNGAACRLLGFGAVQPSLQRCSPISNATQLLIHGEGGQQSIVPLSTSTQALRDLRAATMQGGCRAEIHVTSLDGCDRRCSVHGTPNRGAEGRVTGEVVVLHDISVPTRHEQELTLQVEQLREVSAEATARVEQLRGALDVVADGAVTDAVVVFDRSERIVHCNARARELLNLTLGSDRPPLSVCQGLALSILRDQQGVTLNTEHELTRRILGGEVFAYDHALYAVLHTSQGGRDAPLIIRGAPMHDADRQVIGGVLVLRETAGRRPPAVRARSTERVWLTGSQAAATPAAGLGVDHKDEFFATAAHELRNATGALQGYVSMFTERAANGSRSRLAKWQSEALEALAESAEHVADLAEDFMDVARLQSGQLAMRCHPTDLVTLAQRVAQRLQTTTSRHRIVFSSTSLSIAVSVDARRIEQVLTNLIGNAVKYSPDGGEIGVIVHQSRSSGAAVVTVLDHGIGIPANEYSQIFQRFGRAGNARRLGIDGTGLGLYLSQHIVEQHGGKLWFTSKPLQKGNRTAFYLSLPIRADGSGGSEPR